MSYCSEVLKGQTVCRKTWSEGDENLCGEHKVEHCPVQILVAVADTQLDCECPPHLGILEGWSGGGFLADIPWTRVNHSFTKR